MTLLQLLNQYSAFMPPLFWLGLIALSKQVSKVIPTKYAISSPAVRRQCFPNISRLRFSIYSRKPSSMPGSMGGFS